VVERGLGPAGNVSSACHSPLFRLRQDLSWCAPDDVPAELVTYQLVLDLVRWRGAVGRPALPATAAAVQFRLVEPAAVAPQASCASTGPETGQEDGPGDGPGAARESARPTTRSSSSSDRRPPAATVFLAAAHDGGARRCGLLCSACWSCWSSGGSSPTTGCGAGRLAPELCRWRGGARLPAVRRRARRALRGRPRAGGGRAWSGGAGAVGHGTLVNCASADDRRRQRPDDDGRAHRARGGPPRAPLARGGGRGAAVRCGPGDAVDFVAGAALNPASAGASGDQLHLVLTDDEAISEEEEEGKGGPQWSHPGRRIWAPRR